MKGTGPGARGSGYSDRGGKNRGVALLAETLRRKNPGLKGGRGGRPQGSDCGGGSLVFGPGGRGE